MKQAQLELVAADLDFKVAKAGFYPSLGIGATIGYQSFDFLKIVSTPASLVHGIAADLMAPLLNRKALTAAYFTANSKQMQTVYHYERAILNCYIEVSKLLAMIHNLEQSYDLQSQQVEKLTQSIDISSRLFASARADYMEVLLTRRDALEAQMELIENKKRQMNAAVGLYQALAARCKSLAAAHKARRHLDGYVLAPRSGVLLVRLRSSLWAPCRSARRALLLAMRDFCNALLGGGWR